MGNYKTSNPSNDSPYVVHINQINEIYIKYNGKLNEVMSGVNMITPELSELALYPCWYPHFANMPDFTFQIQLKVPDGYVTTTNGRLIKDYHQNGVYTSEWESYQPHWDMVLFCACKKVNIQKR